MSENEDTFSGNPDNPIGELSNPETAADLTGTQSPGSAAPENRPPPAAVVKPAAGKRPVARRKYVKKAKKQMMPLKISYRSRVPDSDSLTSPPSGPTPMDSEMPVLTPEPPLTARPRPVQGRLPGTSLASRVAQEGRKAQAARMPLTWSGEGRYRPLTSPAASCHRNSAGSSPHSDPQHPQQPVRAAGDSCKLSMHVNYVSGYSRPPEDLVSREHTYSKPHNWQQEHEYVRPARYLFAEKPSSARLQQKDLPSDDVLDIETVDAEPSTPHAQLWRSAHSWDQLDQLTAAAEDRQSDEDEAAWDENISRDGWSAPQSRLFAAAVSALESLELRRLVSRGTHAECAAMQTAYAMYANELRHQLVGCYNDYRLPVWLHLLLVAHLPPEFKMHYAELLTRMRSAIPHIVDVMVKTPPPPQAPGRLAAATIVAPNIELPPHGVDVVAEQLLREKFKRLPNSPVFLVIPEDHRAYRKARFILFTSMLSQMGQTFTVQHTQAPDGATVLQGLDHKMAEARGKLIELRSKLSGRQVTLVGFGTGAALAAQLALMEPVFAVVCLGFPASTAGGVRGGPDDAVLTLRSPVLFVIGEHAHTATAGQIDTMRGRMVVHSQLVVLGMSDDTLVMPRQRLIDLKVTQAMVDKSILVEIHTFLGQLLTTPASAPASAYAKSKMASSAYKRLPKHPLLSPGATGDGNTAPLKTTTRRYVKKSKTFQVAGSVPCRKYVPRTTLPATSPVRPAAGAAAEQPTADQAAALSKRKARVSATQQLMINSAKYASELPPDYAAQLQDTQLAPGLWQSKYKNPMLSPTKQSAAPGGMTTSPPPVSASSVFITPPVPTPVSQTVKVISSSPCLRAVRKPSSSASPSAAPLIASSLPSGCFSLSSRSSDRGGTVTVLSPRPQVITVSKQPPLTADSILNLPIIFAKDNDGVFGKAESPGGNPSPRAPPHPGETHKIVNKFEFSKPQPGVKYRKIFLTRMTQPKSEGLSSGIKPGIKSITIQPNAIVDSIQTAPGSSGGILGRQLAGPRGAPRMLGPVRHVGPGRPPGSGRQLGPGRPPGPGRGRPVGGGRGGGRAPLPAVRQTMPMTDDLKFEVFLEDLEEDLGKRGMKTKGSTMIYHEFSPKKSCP